MDVSGGGVLEAVAPNDEQKQQIVAELTELTGTDADSCRYLLEAYNWQLELAAEAFFETDGGVPAAAANDDVEFLEEVPPNREEDNVQSATTAASSQTTDKQPKMSRKIATLHNKEESASSDDESEKGQAFYVGGSERSGQEVLGPPKRPDKKTEGGAAGNGASSSSSDAAGIVDRMFKDARAQGAKTDEEMAPSGSTGGGQSVRFVGTAYKLGDSITPSTKISDGATPRDDEQSQLVPVSLYMYANGLVIGEEGDLFPTGSPQFQSVVASISAGRIPIEIVRMHPGREIDLRMVRKTDEEYKPPKKPFTGSGRRLGGIVPSLVTDTPPVAPMPVAAASTAATPPAIPVDESKPSTQVRIRLLNGKQLTAKLNHTHLVSDLRAFIHSHSPEYASQPYRLMTSFPSKLIEDESQTLADAKLLNSVVVQKKQN